MSIRPLVPLVLAALLATFAHAGPDAPAVGAPKVQVSPFLTQPALDLPPAMHDALRSRDWSTAIAGLQKLKTATWTEGQRADHAFVLAWALVAADRAKEAAPLIAALSTSPSAPPAHRSLVLGRVLAAQGDIDGAMRPYQEVPAGSGAWPEAALARASALSEAGRAAEARAIYREMIARPDPAEGSAAALLALAAEAPADDAYTLLRRVWTEYPRSAEAGTAASRLAAGFASQKATWQEAARRGEVLMNAGDYGGALATTEPFVGQVDGQDVHACRFLLVRGRSLYRTSKLGAAVQAFGDIGPRCTSVDADYGPKGLFLAGQAQYRRSEFAAAAQTFLSIPKLYPRSSFADDGLAQAGIASNESGDAEAAARAWERALAEYPDGDMVPEVSLRLALARYYAGKPDEARDIAARLGALPLTGDWVHVAAGRYWAARLALYPDATRPDQPVDDPARRKEAIEGWASLCADMPHSFYAILAWSRLKEVDPERAAAVAARPAAFDHGDRQDPWAVRLSFWQDPGAREGIDLARLGLLREAQAEWGRLDESSLTGDEMAWIVQLRAMNGDWLLAHDDMRGWIGDGHPPGTLGPRQAQVLRVAYPDRYWDDVQAATVGYHFEPRLFHALVREESNFNRTIKSSVGARGLSQLMPATAKEVARWTKVSYAADLLDDPTYNTRLGARYFEAMILQHRGSPYLSCAAYNAGGGRTKQWLEQWGNIPTDEYIERIPFKETRGYVKRVMGTWQLMRWQFDDGPLFYDLSAFNHHARP